MRLRGCGGHGLRFVTVMHAPVVAGETRPCSDVGSPGGGDDAGSYLEVGRIARCRWIGLLGNGLGSNLFGYFSWALCLGLRMVVRSRGHQLFLVFNKILDGKKNTDFVINYPIVIRTYVLFSCTYEKVIYLISVFIF